MNKVFKSDQIYVISKKLGIPQTEVRRVLDCYCEKLRNDLEEGKTVKFLNICYLVNRCNKVYYNETLAYISHEIGLKTKLGKELVYRVLLTLEELITKDLCSSFSYVIRGLVSISLIEYNRGTYKVRIRKSESLSHLDIRVLTLNSFKRKVEN